MVVERHQTSVRWCLEDGIYTIADLKNRLVSHQEYRKLWYERCAEMQKELEAKRKLEESQVCPAF